MQGYLIALLIGTPIGFFLGLSKTFSKMFDPIFQVLRPVSPLAWLPLGMVLFLGAKLTVPGLGGDLCGIGPRGDFHDRDLLDVAHRS